MNLHFHLKPENAAQLSQLCGVLDENIHTIARFFEVSIKRRGAFFEINGAHAQQAQNALVFFLFCLLK